MLKKKKKKRGHECNPKSKAKKKNIFAASGKIWGGEILTSLKKVKTVLSLFKIKNNNNKSPGTSGITSEFYKAFCNEALFLFEIFTECWEKECLLTTRTQGLTVLILKPNKDLFCIKDSSSICLLNSDYEIFALASVKKLKLVLNLKLIMVSLDLYKAFKRTAVKTRFCEFR